MDKDARAREKSVTEKKGKVLRAIDRQLLEDAASRDADVLKTLLSQGANARIQNEDGVTPLMIAASSGKISCIDVLAPTSNFDDEDFDGWTALCFAVASGETASVDKLLALGARKGVLFAGKSLLMLASERGSVEMLRLLRTISSIDAVDSRGWTAKDYAADKKNEECVALLEQWALESCVAASVKDGEPRAVKKNRI